MAISNLTTPDIYHIQLTNATLVKHYYFCKNTQLPNTFFETGGNFLFRICYQLITNRLNE